MERSFRPIVRLWLVLAGLCLLCLALFLLSSENILPFWNALVLSIICLSTWGTAYALLQTDQNMVWTPIFWFVLMFGVYFGFGSMIILFGPKETVEYLNMIQQINQFNLLQITLLNISGFFITLTAFLSFSFFFPIKNRAPVDEVTNLRQAKSLAILFLCIGGSVNYLFIIPKVFGLTETTLPGALATLQLLLYIGIVLLSYLRVKTNEWSWNLLFFLLIPLEATTSFLTYSKQAFLMIPLLIGLGGFLAHKNIKKLAFMGVVSIALYVYIKPIISDAREEYYNQAEHSTSSPFQTRLEIIQRVITRQNKESTTDDEDSTVPMDWWVRLCYANVQAFALYEISQGNEFNTYKNLPYVFIPRFLMPDKPIMTEDGYNFTEMINGTRTSSTGLGVYMEGYWNSQPLGLIFFSLYLGILFSFLSYQSLSFIRYRQWFYMPLAFMAVQLGMGPVNWFVPSFIGSMALYMGYYLIFWFFSKLKLVA